MFCLNCGKELADGAVFCGNCGHRVDAVPSATQETVIVPEIPVDVPVDAVSADRPTVVVPEMPEIPVVAPAPQTDPLKEMYPDFEVVVKAPSKRKGEYKGLTYAYMRAYITKHDDDKKSKMAEFKNLLAEDKQNEELVEAACYFEVREWFLNTFKEVAEFKETRKAEIKKIVKKAA